MDSEFLIIGGGVAGLTAAIALQSIGRDFRLFEQSQLLQGIGAGFGLAANAMQALEILDLKAEIEQLGYYIDNYNIRSEKGEILFSPDTKRISEQYSQKNFAIHRADLHAYLLSKIQRDHIILGKRAQKLEQEENVVRVFFEDGSVYTAKYLIIADGVKSRLRQQLVPSSTPRYAGYTCWRATIDNSDIQLDTGFETWGRAGRFGVTPLVDNRIYWYACVNGKPNSPAFKNTTTNDLWKRFQHYHAPIPKILAATQDKNLIWSDIIDIEPLQHLAYHNILIIGDAGHATTPNMGQGACQAIEDVAVLIDELKRDKTTVEAFRSFEKRRLARTRYITETSQQIGHIAQWENPYLITLRNTLAKILPNRIKQHSLSKLLSKDFMQINTP
ncbi:FAD-dependent monooxygenase [Sphingobacterium faecale]|uniref:FAD-dependent monooxygenase n=1 Tax=Sphingobacterium faecale TaxID=2803775 RepID=A0ABS1R140_9SPHI|nr:FAD-dependent monooxygenase [Sphingobacterium faecale]MBL1407767.1 FAD-dependent monooxygenase [Sphingobacterium faecale]